MKNKLYIIILMLFSISLIAQEKKCQGFEKEWNTGEIVYLFEDDVNIRVKPSLQSEIITSLRIGTPLTIMDVTEHETCFNGIETPWYKVKYKNQIGFVPGDLIALIHVESENLRCLVDREKIDDKYFLIIRVLTGIESKYFENKTEFLGDNFGFGFRLSGNKGLSNVKNIIYVHYLPESCGANFGGYHLIFDDNNLFKVMDLFSRANILFTETEELFFPEDSLGLENRIIYRKEKIVEIEHEKKKKSRPNTEFEWINGKLSPDPNIILQNRVK